MSAVPKLELPEIILGDTYDTEGAADPLALRLDIHLDGRAHAGHMGDMLKALHGLIGQHHGLVAIRTAAIATLVYIDPGQRAHALIGLQHHRTHPDAETHHDHDGRRTDGDAEDREHGPHLPSLQVTRRELDKIK